MRVQVYEQLMAMQRSRRDVLKGAAGAAALRRKLVRPVIHAVFRRRQHRVADHENPRRRQRLAD